MTEQCKPGPLVCLLRRGLLLMALALPLAGISSFESLFAPKKDLWPRWERHDPTATLQVDHAAWDDLVKRYVTPGDLGLNRFSYAKVSSADRAILKDYLARLSGTAVSSLRREEQLPYWINLYNALTVQVVLDHLPVDSIRDIDISPGLFADGPWGRELISVEGEEISLNDIEHRILRPIWNDPRIHYAVNCASVGCPNLQAEAFTARNTESALEDGARAYINSPRGARATAEGLEVSSIYAWFQEDFGGDDAGILAHLNRYAEAALRDVLAAKPDIVGHSYDWTLNGDGAGGS